MKISFSTLACPKWDWNMILDEACRLGYDGIEIRGIEGEMNLVCMRPFLPENIDQTIKVLKEKNLEICCLDTSCNFHEKENFEKVLKEGKKAIDLAQKLNCKYIRVFGDKIPDKNNEDEIITQIAAGLNELGNYAEGKGVTVLIESHGDFSTGGMLQKLLQQVSSKQVEILWDVANAYIDFGESLKDTFDKISGHIKHTHMKDAKGKYPSAELCMVGKGDLSFIEMISLLNSIGYDGWLSLEWEKWWHPKLEEPEIVLDVYIHHINKSLASLN